MIFNQYSDGRKVRQFSLSQAFLSAYHDRQPAWGPIGFFTYKRCVDVSTPVLCTDLQWRPAGSIKEGDGIIGFDEESDGHFRHVRTGRVMHNKVEKADTVGIELENGEILYATPDHGWLVKFDNTNNRLHWVESKDLMATGKRGDAQLLRPFGPVWATDQTYEGGFLAAAFDGEGCFDRVNSLSFIQVANPMLKQVEQFLENRGVPFVRSPRKLVKGRQPCFSLRVNCRDKFLPLLGSLRPPRLLEVFHKNVQKEGGDLGALRCDPENYVKVVRVFPAGFRDIAVLSTDLKTHFTGGYASHNTYARDLPDGGTEEFWQTCQRVVEGCFNIQKIHCHQMGLPWNEQKAQHSAQDMFERMWAFKFSPPGRGLSVMGTDIVYQRGSASLQNCSFVSSDSIGEDFADPFCFLMDMSMLGVGTGADTKGAGKVKIVTPKATMEPHVVPDTREGWVDLIRIVLNSFVGRGCYPQTIDYSLVRGRGEPLKTFGGTASGPKPLHDLVVNLTKLLLPKTADVVSDVETHDDYATISTARTVWEGPDHSPYRITSTQIVDIFNFIGKAVVAGGIRRTAEIMFGEPDDRAFMELKQDVDALNDRRWACVVGDTRVETTEGSIPIKDLVGRTDVKVILDGKVYPALGIKKTGHKPVFQVTSAGGPDLIATANHQVMTQRGWVRVDDLQLSDSLIPSDNAPFTDTVDRESLDYKHGYLIGALIGDGTYVSNSTTKQDIARIMTYVGDKGESSLRAYMTDIFQFPTRSDFKGFSGPHGKGTAAYYFMGCSAFTKLAASYGVRRGNKRLTQEIEKASIPFVAGVLSGIFDADGYVMSGRRTLGVDQIDKDNLMIVQRLLLRLGIASRVYVVRQAQEKRIGNGGVTHSQALYRLILCGYDHASRFVSLCGLHHPHKMSAWGGVAPPTSRRGRHHVLDVVDDQGVRVFTDRVFFNVSSVTPVGTEDVFDVCVPGPHAFSANGLYVHNSNNSVFGYVGMDYTGVAQSLAINGEPGIVWLDTAKKFGRLNDDADNKDWRISGTNPCGEMGLESRELCNLVETYPAHHDSYEDFERTLKMAYLYAKTVTLVPTHDMRANAVMMRNRRIGASMSGIVQAIQKFGRRKFLNWCDNGYKYIQKMDRTYSDWLGVPLSVKTTTVKPSGTVSLLCGATPGIHFPHSEFYVRHVRVQNQSPLCQIARDAGFQVFPDAYADNTSVVAFPVKEKHFIKGKADVSMWEQFVLSADMQRYWSDNLVSATVTFKKSEVSDIKTCLEAFESQLKGVSLLPLLEEDHGYTYPPYQTITEQQYLDMTANIREMVFTTRVHDTDERFCSGDTCLLVMENTTQMA